MGDGSHEHEQGNGYQGRERVRPSSEDGPVARRTIQEEADEKRANPGGSAQRAGEVRFQRALRGLGQLWWIGFLWVVQPTHIHGAEEAMETQLAATRAMILENEQSVSRRTSDDPSR